MKHSKIQDLILEQEKQGKVVFRTIEGLASVPIDEFIKQPAEGILYDLNRDKVTVLTFIDDPKWVNDYAVGCVITKLKEVIEKLTHELSAAQAEIRGLESEARS